MKRILIAILMILSFYNIAYAAKPKVGADQLKAATGLINTDGSLKVYTKDEIDSGTAPIALKANSTDVYTKSEVDAKVSSGGSGSSSNTVEIKFDENINAGDVVFFTDYAGDIRARKSTTITGNPSIETPVNIPSASQILVIKTVQLTDNSSMIVYYDSSKAIYACITSITDGNLTMGNANNLAITSSGNIIEIDIIDSNSVVLLYAEANLKMCVLTNNAGTISVSKNSDLGISAGYDGFMALGLCKINATQYGVVHKKGDGTSDVEAILVVDNGSNFSVSHSINPEGTGANSSYWHAAIRYDDTSFLCSHDGSETNIYKINIVGGNTLSRVGKVTLGGMTQALRATKFTESLFVFSGAYKKNSLIKVTGNDLTLVDTTLMTSHQLTGSDGAIYSLSSTTGICVYADYDDNNYLKVLPITVSDTEIINGTPLNTTFKISPNMYYPNGTFNIIGMTTDKLMLAYINSESGNYGIGKASIYNTDIIELIRNNIIGISQTTTTINNNGIVLLSGISPVHTGLIPNQTYYLQSIYDLSIGTTPISISKINKNYPTLTSEVKIGTAKSATELIVNIDYK
ncbi:MAG TPA: hypothetical protein PKI46_00015 [Bacteroidales bacterium]|nr:hypothetical protein [Bacteroidales bacterium]